MATAPIPPDVKTQRKYVRAWIRLERDNQPLTERQADDLDRIARGLAHWYTDDLDDWACDCDACLWWQASIRASRRA
jgi:hypothetical protein